MRILLALAIVGAFLMAGPVADASHMGPCTHEYVDYYKQIVWAVQQCLNRDPGAITRICQSAYCTLP
jgi:hypothetical protein